jgi:hypothetical protein
MSTKLILKKSLTGGSVPNAADIDAGELAINLVDRKIYSKNGSGAVVRLDAAYVESVAPSNPTEGDLWYDTTNDLLKVYDGSGFVSAGYQELAELEDVVISDVADNEILAYDSTTDKWINQTLSELDIAAASTLETTVENYFSVTDNGGDGSLTYSSGVFTYTGPSAAETRAHFTGGTGIDITDGDISVDFNEFTLDSISEAPSPTNLFFTLARARGAISVTDSGGDGSLLYNSTTGEITYTGPSAAETRAHFSAGTGVSLSNGEISIGQDVGTANDVTFNEVTTNTVNGDGTELTLDPSGAGDDAGTVIIAGNLTVNGTTTAVNSTEVNIGDSIILLNAEETAAPSQNGGIEIERGTADNKAFIWNETDDAWDLANETLQNVTLDGGSY